MPKFDIKDFHQEHLASFQWDHEQTESYQVLSLIYQFQDLKIDTSDLIHPAMNEEKLYEYTCFELFLKSTYDDSYIEFNFDINAQFRTYFFESYRIESRSHENLNSSLEIKKFITGPKSLVIEFKVKINKKINLGNYQLFPTAILKSKKIILYFAKDHFKDIADFHCFSK